MLHAKISDAKKTLEPSTKTPEPIHSANILIRIFQQIKDFLFAFVLAKGGVAASVEEPTKLTQLKKPSRSGCFALLFGKGSADKPIIPEATSTTPSNHA